MNQIDDIQNNLLMEQVLDVESRGMFLQARRSIIGGTDASALCHKNPWKDPMQVWAEKCGLWPDDDVQSEVMKWGILQEDLVAREYMAKTGNKVRRPALLPDKILGFPTRLRRHPEYSWMGAHLDRLILNENRGLECKTTNAFMTHEWGAEGTDQVPEQYLLQCQHYMAVMGYESFDLAVLIGGNNHRVYHIPRDEGLIASLIKIEADFWTNHVETGVCPMPDGSETSMRSVRKLNPTATEREGCISKQADERINAAVGELADADYESKLLEKKINALKGEIQHFMGEASELYIEDVCVATWRQTKDSERFDDKALKAAHPELWAKFLKTTPGYRVFRPDFKSYVKKEARVA
jgi:putative phage-type endonuclease